MTARESLLLSVRWDGKCIIDPMLFKLDMSWLRRTIVRELLVYVLKEGEAKEEDVANPLPPLYVPNLKLHQFERFHLGNNFHSATRCTFDE